MPCPRLRDLSDPGIEPSSLMSPALADRFFTMNLPLKLGSFAIFGALKNSVFGFCVVVFFFLIEFCFIELGLSPELAF